MKINLLKAALFTPGPNNSWGIPLLLWGLPGVAKSAILRWLAAEYHMPIEVLSPASRGEGAFGVTPVPSDNRMTYPRPDWTDKFEKAGRGIVFVDEINLAATHYAGALLGLLQDRVLGSYQMSKGVRVFAAANPIDLAAASGGWDLSAPAANRVGHLDWPCPDVKAWTDWLLTDNSTDETAGYDSSEEERRVMAAWPTAWGEARGVVAGFLSANATHLHALPQGGSATMSRAWPSPRTWEYAARAMAAATIHTLSEVERDEFVGCFIGDGATGELFTWYAAANLPNSADLLDGKARWEHRPSRLDITTAVFGSAVALCTSTADTNLRKKRSEAMWGLLAQASNTAPDLIVTPAKVMINAKLFTGSVKTLSKVVTILEAAGIKAQP
jgi:hypothetical protein